MKTSLIILSVIVLPVLINSCKKNETGNSLPYYQFSEDDKSKLLVSYDTGKELVYKNQDDEEIRFKIISSVNGKTSYSTGTFWESYAQTFFYYDRQQIILQFAEIYTGYDFEVYLQRYPLGSNYNIQYPVTGTPTFTGYLRFPLWNSYSDTLTLDNRVFIDFTMPVTAIAINGKLYPKVRTIESGKTGSLGTTSSVPSFQKNVNRLYYDQNYGIIGFDDANGKMWRLQ